MLLSQSICKLHQSTIYSLAIGRPNYGRMQVSSRILSVVGRMGQSAAPGLSDSGSVLFLEFTRPPLNTQTAC
jgi:hypothetical protein